MAIAFDNLAENNGAGGGTQTYALTVGSGTNRILFVGATANFAGAQSTDPFTGITYAGAAMTLIVSAQRSSDGWATLWYLVNPASGANNVVVSVSPNAAGFYSAAASYTGANQTGQPDGQASGTGSASTRTNTITSTADNCWHVGYCCEEAGSTQSAGTGTTLRSTGNAQGSFFDNNAAITPAGSNSIVSSWSGSAPSAMVGATFKPVAAAGPANWKTYNTNAKANIKTLNTNTLANIKTYDTIS